MNYDFFANSNTDQENTECISTFLGAVKYKQQVLLDDNNGLSLTPLMFAYLQNKQQVIEALQNSGANLLHSNSLSQSLLHIAAIHAKPEALKAAIESKVDPNGVDSFGNTPLHYASKAGYPELMRELLKAGAKRDIQNLEKKYPVHLAVESQKLEAYLLLERDLQSVKFEQIHPVHIAASIADTAILKAMIEKDKAVVFCTDVQQLTPLHYTIPSNNLQHARMLIANGARLNKVDEYGNTALHFAVLENKPEMVQLLVEEGADPMQKNTDGLTAVDCAFHAKCKPIINYFRTLGRSDMNAKYFKNKY